MARLQFEGSYLGDDSRIPPTARMECKICWYVYDPALGCTVWQVPAGTPFAALPPEWRCPTCDGERNQFMLLDSGDGTGLGKGPEVLADAQVKVLEATFRDIAARGMAGVPIVNDKLSVKAVDFRPHEGSALGVLITPWFMNLILLPLDPTIDAPVVGTKRLVDFPSGRYEFVQGHDDRLGPWEGCSLFSPMFEFKSTADAVDVAQAVMVSLFDPDIREGGAPTAEIRQRREAALAAAVAAQAPAPAADTGDAGGAASRRALLFGAVPAKAEGA